MDLQFALTLGLAYCAVCGVLLYLASLILP